MRFALYGVAREAQSFVRAIVAHGSHQLAALLAPADWQPAWLQGRPEIRRCGHWEEFLTLGVDAVILAEDDEHALAAARRLAEAGLALIVVPGSENAASLAYELTLLRGQRQVAHFPLFQSRVHPLLDRLRSLVRAGALGRVQHVQLEHRDVDAGTAASALLSRSLAADIDVLRAVFGEFDQVTAVRAGEPPAPVSLMTVTLGGAASPQAICTTRLGAAQFDWRLIVTGERASATLAGDPAAGRLTLETNGVPAETVEFDAGAHLLAAFEDAVQSTHTAGAPAQPLEPAGAIRPADWHDLTRNVDLLDAVERSIRRRRTIDVYFDVPSERGVFKSQMTAAGCSLLMATLLLLVAYLTLAAMLDLPTVVKRVLVVLIFAPLGLFLAFQTLLLLTRPAEKKPAANESDRA